MIGGSKRSTSLARRLVLIATLWSLVLFAVGGVTLSWVFARSVRQSFDDRLEVLLEGLIAVAEVGPGGVLVVSDPPGEPRFRTPLSGWYWQIETTGALVRSRSLWDQDLPAAAAETAVVNGPSDQRLRMLSRAIMIGDRIYRFRVAGDTEGIARATARFSLTVVSALSVLGLTLVMAVLFQVMIGLRPLARLGEAIKLIRSGEAERLDGEYPRELEPVVAELNSLIEQNQEVIERARAHGGNLAHALKTPLSILANEAERDDDHRIARATRRELPRIERLITHHLARARMAGVTSALASRQRVAPVVDELIRTLQKLYERQGIRLTRGDTHDALFQGEREDLLEMLGNLLENACKWARSQVRVSLEPAADGFDAHVDDDGPGLPAEERERAIERGRRLDESVPGSGLGLAIVADHAKLYRGRLVLAESPLGGLRATLHLPGRLVTKPPTDVAAG